jgi:hypothetical protein
VVAGTRLAAIVRHGSRAGTGCASPSFAFLPMTANNERLRDTDMDESSRQLLLATFAYLVLLGGLIGTLGAAFGG